MVSEEHYTFLFNKFEVSATQSDQTSLAGMPGTAYSCEACC